MPSYGFLSTHPPTRCGLATFNSALAAHLTADGTRGGIVRVTDPGDDQRPGPGVVHTWSARTPAGWRDAAAVLNTFDVAIVQHEYGIYPGTDGEDVLPLLRRLTVPSVVVLHTVLRGPSVRQKSLLEQIVATAGAVVTMTDTARDRLLIGYDVPVEKVTVIPHGAAELAGVPVDRRTRPHLLTWGLIGPGKGIECSLRALARLQDLEPTPTYTVAGRTHPKVIEHHGESYRAGLHRLGAQLGIAHAVDYQDVYHDRGPRPPDPLRRRGRAAVRLPRTGHLRRAHRGGGRRSARRGHGVPARRRAAHRRARSGRTPPEPGGAGPGGPADPDRAGPRGPAGRPGAAAGRGPALAGGGSPLRHPRRTAHRSALARCQRGVGVTATAGRPRTLSSRRWMTAPAPSFAHLVRLSDDTGLFEHARHAIVRREHGYCTDDVARGLVVLCREPEPTEELLRLAERYLAFLTHAQDAAGAFHNRLGHDRRWTDEPGLGDWWGRALWGLGTAVARSPAAWVREEALVAFSRGATRRSPAPHAMAFAGLGAAEVLRRHPGHVSAAALLADAASAVGTTDSDPRWPWPQQRLTYANGAFAEVVIVASQLRHGGPPSTRACGCSPGCGTFNSVTGGCPSYPPPGGDVAPYGSTTTSSRSRSRPSRTPVPRPPRSPVTRPGMTGSGRRSVGSSVTTTSARPCGIRVPAAVTTG